MAPTGEPAASIFHVKKALKDSFRQRFVERLGEAFALLTVDEVDELRLYGPDPLSALMRERLGTFIAVSKVPAAIYAHDTPLKNKDLQRRAFRG